MTPPTPNPSRAPFPADGSLDEESEDGSVSQDALEAPSEDMVGKMFARIGVVVRYVTWNSVLLCSR
jgi:hypothetical protein